MYFFVEKPKFVFMMSFSAKRSHINRQNKKRERRSELDPNRKTKFSTYLANQAKWKCLNILNKKKRENEYSIEEMSFNQEPSDDSFIKQINKEEAFSLFQTILNKEKDLRIKKIIDLRYNVDNNKLTPWRKISESLDMSIQGCINIHNRFINKVKKELNYV